MISTPLSPPSPPSPLSPLSPPSLREHELASCEEELLKATLQQQELLELRKALRLELREWERAFEQREGRPASDADRAGQRGRFDACWKAVLDAKEAARLVQLLGHNLALLRNNHSATNP
mmetsp:Transcript_28972/g.65051  ORF Transcript_28972/g.65051 Transcript_28972/m.65051 type:complete len:120 (+) Transcript_28972:2-361(+)